MSVATGLVDINFFVYMRDGLTDFLVERWCNMAGKFKFPFGRRRTKVGVRCAQTFAL